MNIIKEKKNNNSNNKSENSFKKQVDSCIKSGKEKKLVKWNSQ